MENDNMKRTLIKRFLFKFKNLVVNGKLNIIQRRAEYASIIEMTPEAIKQVLLKLKPEDYVKEEEDRDRKNEYIWVFIKDENSGQKFYIKLKLLTDEARVISFHHPLYI